MYAPSPIVLTQTPSTGLRLPITAERGGLLGLILLSQVGPPCTVEFSADDGANWEGVVYPHTLAAGTLRLTRSDSSSLLSVLHALAPLDEGSPPDDPPPDDGWTPYERTIDAGGYQTITNTQSTTDVAGYQILLDGTATTDSGGYQTVERSYP